MSNKKFPYVPPELLRALDDLYPAQSPKKGETMDDLMFRGGCRHVVEFLKFKSEDQTKNAL